MKQVYIGQQPKRHVMRDPSHASKGNLRSAHIMAAFWLFLERNSYKTGPGMPNSSKPVINNCLQEGDELLLKLEGKYS